MNKSKHYSRQHHSEVTGNILLGVGTFLMVIAIIIAVARAYVRLKLPFILFASGIAVFVAGGFVRGHFDV